MSFVCKNIRCPNLLKMFSTIFSNGLTPSPRKITSDLFVYSFEFTTLHIIETPCTRLKGMHAWLLPLNLKALSCFSEKLWHLKTTNVYKDR